jgi:hypothetical protein
MMHKTVDQWLGDEIRECIETERSASELLVDGTLTPERRALVEELRNSFAERRGGLERTRAARLARLEHHHPRRNDGRLPSISDGRQPACGRK